jgi:hypothetical protein
MRANSDKERDCERSGQFFPGPNRRGYSGVKKGTTEVYACQEIRPCEPITLTGAVPHGNGPAAHNLDFPA